MRDDTIAALRMSAEPPKRDAHPRRSGREEVLARHMDEAARLLGNYRDEMADRGYLPPDLGSILESEIAGLK
jgi:hypothetical protein